MNWLIGYTLIWQLAWLWVQTLVNPKLSFLFAKLDFSKEEKG